MTEENEVSGWWMPIESAPKDKLVWLKGDRLGLHPYIGLFDEATGRWAFNLQDASGLLIISPQPTHWAPIP